MTERQIYTALANENESGPTAPLRWIADSVAQAMVLLNGIVLSALIYVVFSFYVTDLLKDDYQRLITDTQQAVSENLLELERSIRTVATILDLSSAAGEKEIGNRIAQASGRINRFDRILWIRKDSEEPWRIGDVTPERHSEDSGYFSLQEADQDLVDFIVSAKEREKEGQTIIVELPGAGYSVKHNAPLVKERPVLFIRSVGQGSAVVGITRISNIITGNWIYNRPAVSRIVLQDSETGQRLFYMDRSPVGEVESAEEKLPASSYNLTIGNRIWLLDVDSGKDLRTRFLENTPYTVFVFCLFLTLLATLYVHSIRRHMGKMGLMKITLSRKNQELNNEISERERLGKILQKAELEYKAIVDSVSDIIFESTTEGDLIFLNSAWKKITGFEIEKSLGKNLFDMLHPQDREEHRSRFEKMTEGYSLSYRSMTRLMTADGKFRNVELSASLMWRGDVRSRRVVGAITDVEERQRAEKALGEAEKKYRAIVENAVAGIYQVTPDGRFLSANTAMARILGYETPEQMLRELKNVQNLYKDKQDHMRFVHELEAEGIVKNFESCLVTVTGKNIWINENARAVRDDHGKILYFEGSIEDVTKRKEAEIALRKAKVESDLANRAKSEFLSNMSHELRTPLNAIIGFSEIIKNEALGPLANKQYWEYARDIHGSGVKLLGVINEILDVSRIEAGERQLNESIVNIGESVRFCVDFMWQRAKSNNLTIVNRIEGKIPQIIGEERALKQILLNLLSNAIKYTPDGGHITLSHEVDSEGCLRLTVSDTGIGMDENEVKKALQPFGQVQSSFNRSSSGAGLGLTLVESLMNLHGGRMELFSQKGIGTAVTITFPSRRIVRDPAEISGGEKSDESSTAGSRILQ